MNAVPHLSKKEVADFVDDYLRRDNQSPKFVIDPIDDAARLVALALELPGSPNRHAARNLGPLPMLQNETSGSRHIRFLGRYLHAVNPFLTEEDWTQIYHAILLARHGRSFVRIRKRRALAAQLKAKRMTPKQLQAEFPHLGRSRIYALIKEANTKR